MEAGDKVIERRVRRALERRGLRLQRCRARDPNATGFGGYQIVDDDGAVICGPGYSITLADADGWLMRPEPPSRLPTFDVVIGHCIQRLRELPAHAFATCVTSPPFWFLRDNGHRRQIGLEPTPDLYVAKLVEAFREVRRVLRPDGTVWLNIGDSYVTRRAIRDDGKRSVARDMARGVNTQPSWRTASASGKALHSSRLREAGLKDKDLLLLPYMVAIALRADGWYLRSNIVWAKDHTAPDPAADRPSRAHEALFLLTKSASYYYDGEPLLEEAAGGGRRWGRDIWRIPPSNGRGRHTSTMPVELARRCILAGSPQGGRVLDPFGGSGTTAIATKAAGGGRSATIIEINRSYAALARERIRSLVA